MVKIICPKTSSLSSSSRNASQNQFCIKSKNEKTISDFRRRKEEDDKKEVISSSFPDVLPWWKRRRTATTTTTTTRDDDEEETNDDDDDEKTTGNDENDDENNDASSRMEITHEPLFRTPPTYSRKTIFFYSSSFKQQRTNWGVTETTEKKVGRCKSENEH